MNLDSTPEIKRLSECLAAMHSPEEVTALLNDLFTIREMQDISQRLSVAIMLDRGHSYSEIEKETGSSASTIARVSKCLTHGNDGYHYAIRALRSTTPNNSVQN